MDWTEKRNFGVTQGIISMQSADNKKFIDIDAIFKAKNPGLYRILPRFIFSYLKRVAHQDDINDFLNTVNDNSQR